MTAKEEEYDPQEAIMTTSNSGHSTAQVSFGKDQSSEQ